MTLGEGGEEGDGIMTRCGCLKMEVDSIMQGLRPAIRRTEWVCTGPCRVVFGTLICVVCSHRYVFLWVTDSPYPDGVTEGDIVIHELSPTHGLSIRLTGGPKISGCLGAAGERLVIAEEFGYQYPSTRLTNTFSQTSLRITVRSASTCSDYVVGAWVVNR